MVEFQAKKNKSFNLHRGRTRGNLGGYIRADSTFRSISTEEILVFPKIIGHIRLGSGVEKKNWGFDGTSVGGQRRWLGISVKVEKRVLDGNSALLGQSTLTY